MRAGYGERLRRLLAGQTAVETVIGFGDLPVFDATTYPTVLVLRKRQPAAEQTTQTLVVEDIAVVQRLVEEVTERAWKQRQVNLGADGWMLVRPELLALTKKLRQAGRSLDEHIGGRFYRGIVTGSNTAFVIEGSTRERLISEDRKSAEIIKPWLRGKDLSRWSIASPDLFLIYVPWELEIERYPAVLRHLNRFRTALEARPEVQEGRFPWYALSRYGSHFVDGFSKPKIIYPHFNTKPNFAYDTSGSFSNDKTYIIPDASKLLLGVLNSSVTDFFLKQLAPSVQQGYLEFRTIYVGQIPMPSVSPDQEAAITAVVDKLVDAKGQGPQVARWEQELNALSCMG